MPSVVLPTPTPPGHRAQVHLPMPWSHQGRLTIARSRFRDAQRTLRNEYRVGKEKIPLPVTSRRAMRVDPMVALRYE
jgi:hypothetical protein